MFLDVRTWRYIAASLRQYDTCVGALPSFT